MLLGAGADPNEVGLILGDPGPEDYAPSALDFAAGAGDIAVIGDVPDAVELG